MIKLGSRRPWAAIAGALTLALSGAIFAGPGAVGANGPNANGKTIDIQLIQYSDWHGSISTAPQFGYLINQEEANNPNTLLLTGGDDFGGTEPVSSLNDDIPAILVQNAFGTDAAGLGNHNFDGGISNLQEKIDLADYPYISSNLANVDDNVTGVAPYVIFTFKPQIKVAVIGFTNEDAPDLVFPGNFGTIEVTDQAEALMAARAQAKSEGADIFVAIGHEGVRTIDGAGNPSGELIDLANELQGFHAVLGDHTNVEFIGNINGAIVAEARSGGASYNRITLSVKPGSGKIVGTSAVAVPIDPAGPADPDIQALVQPFFDGLGAQFDIVIGQSGGFWNRGSSAYERRGEAELGNLFADAMLASAPNANIALTNSGGIRSTLSPSNYAASDPGVDRDLVFPDDIVVGDLFSLHNFGNLVTTQNVTGATLHAAIEHGISSIPAGAFPQVAGFQVIYDSSLPAGSRILSMKLDNGTAILNDASQTFKLATNNFVSTGGDGYAALNDPSFTSLGLLTTAIGDYIAAQAGPIAPYFDCRMVDQNPAGPATTRAVNPLGPFGARADCP